VVELRICKGSDFRLLAFSPSPHGLQFENLKGIRQNFASNALVRILPPQTTKQLQSKHSPSHDL
jgi:hypothetical protein